MSVLQQYYTSFVNKESGSAGFQIKAMSPGIPPDVQSTIARLIAYRIPPTLTEYDVSRHPIALRYLYEGVERCIFLCSQSNGSDENGRPGNFFAHTLVMEPGTFKRVPPILYWRSSFWLTKDTGSSSSISPLPDFDVEPVLEIENVWSFLAEGRRIEYFHKLISAVVHYQTGRRRIVIIDNADNVAMWVAAVSCMLPPDYRPMLSFATYHHDPYQAQFMITGTTTDSSFRASPEEYMSFFIVNTVTGRVSDVDESPYAEEASLAAQSIEEYETRLLPLFMNYMQRFPLPTCIDEQLDQMVLYARILDPQYQAALTANDLQAISKVLTTFEQSNNFTRTDLLELSRLGTRLYDAYESQSEEEKAIYTEYYRIVALQKIHEVPTGEAALNELEHFTQRLLREPNPEVVLPRLNNMRRTYGEEMFLSTLNGTDYLSWLYRLLEQAIPQHLIRIWTYLGPYIRLNQHSQEILLISLSVFGQLWIEKRSREGGDLFNAINIATTGREQQVLQLAVEKYSALPDNTLQRFYCRQVYPIELDRRVPYRTVVQTAYADISVLELRYEIGKAGVEKGLDALERWIGHAKRQRMPSIPELIDEGLTYLQVVCNRSQQQYPQQWYDLVPRILTSKVLEPLPQGWEDRLVDTALSKVSLSGFTSTDIKMCKKYQNRKGLSEETRTVIDGLLAMQSGELDADLEARLHKRFMRLSSGMYQEEANSFISEFLGRCVSKESHNFMVNMIFSWKTSEYFWQPYWDTFSEILIHASTAEQAIKLLSYWFTSPPDMFEMPYTVQYFFLNVPQKLEEAQKARGFQDVVRQINSLPEKQKPGWYPLMQDYFTGRKNVFVAVGQNLAGQFQKRLVSQSAEEKEVRAKTEQREKEKFEARIATLFEDKKVRQSHRQNLLAVYQSGQLAQFWASYWEKFTQSFLSHDVDYVLELLAFWFDESFETLTKMREIPYGFFLGLSEALEVTRKERGFRERARQVSARGTHYSQQSYPWYGVVQDYFAEQERGMFPFFKRS